MINDNVIDLVQPGEVGKPAEVTWRPHCSLLRIESRVETIAVSGKAEMFIRDHDGLLTVTAASKSDKQPARPHSRSKRRRRVGTVAVDRSADGLA